MKFYNPSKGRAERRVLLKLYRFGLLFYLFGQTVVMTHIIKNKLSVTLKILTVLASLGGVTLSLIFAARDGYSHWSKRLLYFTAQSNIWLGAVFILLLFSARKEKMSIPCTQQLYLLKYVFTVSITVTGLTFCGLLAPFSDDSYTPWTFCNLLTHVFSPVFAVADFYLDPPPIKLRAQDSLLCLLPPLFYCSTTIVLEICRTDFGRGVPYPYFFLYFRSPVGLFGFSKRPPFILGTFYWLCLFLLLVLLLGFFFARRSVRKK